MAIDQYGRRLHYLRVSLTDRCNLRCIYCMPEKLRFKPRRALMRDNEVLLFVRLFVDLGFDKFRLTGGEPTLRPGIVGLVGKIAHTPGVRSLTMTTNGVRLADLAGPLAGAGLQRVNISLDTLDPQQFRLLTGRGSLEDVWAGVRAAEQAGLTPIKINAVVVCDANEGGVVDLARLTRDHPWQVRFIEMMPFSQTATVQCSRIVTTAEIRACIEAALGPLEHVNGGRLDGEARLFRLAGAVGTVGFISSVTQPFCAACTRVRLTADGRLRLCLLRDDEVDLLTPLRAGASEEALRLIASEALWEKPWGHGLAQGLIPQNRTMSEIGG